MGGSLQLATQREGEEKESGPDTGKAEEMGPCELLLKDKDTQIKGDGRGNVLHESYSGELYPPGPFGKPEEGRGGDDTCSHEDEYAGKGKNAQGSSAPDLNE